MKVSLGGIEVPVTEQRYARLQHTLSKTVAGLGDGLEDIDGWDNLLAALGERTYQVLEVLVPALSEELPEWKFRGFVSREAFERGEYDPERDETSPTVPEIKRAFTVAFEVNGLDVGKAAGGLKGLLDPTLLQAIVSGLVEDALPAIQQAVRESTSGSSSSPSTSGDSVSTRPSPPSPTSRSLPGSLSPV